MKKYIFTSAALALFLCALPCSSSWYFSHVESGGACATQSADVSQTSTNDNSQVLYDEGYCEGQSFQCSAGTIYSIKVDGGTTLEGSPTLDLRFDVNADLGTYTAAVTGVAGALGEMEFVFAEGDRPSVSASTTYYFGVRNTGGWANRMTLSLSNANPYANGTNWYGGGGVDDWVLDTQPGSGGQDLYFIIMMCD